MRQEEILGDGPAFQGKVIRIDKLPVELRQQFMLTKEEQEARDLEIRTSEARRRSELEGV